MVICKMTVCPAMIERIVAMAPLPRMEDRMETWKLVILLIPLVALELTLMIVALVDLVKRERVKFDNKVVWALLIVLVNIIGPVVYLVWGREEEPGSDDDY